MQSGYLDFDLDLRPGSGQEYVVVARSAAGETYSTLDLPPSQELDATLAGVQAALRGDLPAAGESLALTLGRQLFEALFVGDLRSAYDVSLREAQRRGKGLRLRLALQVPELARIPWELLYDSRQGEYLCLSRDTPLVRYLDLPRPPGALAVTPPLRILGMVVSPSDLPPLKVARERELLTQALAGLCARGVVELSWLEGATWADLQQAMWGGPWHVFHFIGHGEFDHARDEGFIMLADADGRAFRFSATQLARLLGDHNPLRLALLNACEGAMGGARSIFSSMASLLVRRDVPAVLAMQYEISDTAALDFAQSFYAALAHGMSVDAAVAEARKAVSLARDASAEWAIPALYMRSPDGVLFDMGRLAPAAASPLAQPAPTDSPAQAAPALGAPADVSAPAETTPPPNNLPANLTPLIGRSQELAQVCELVLRRDVRLVTLVGPGGSGKTRLALEAARAVLAEFRDGVFLIDLAPVADPSLVLSSIAHTLGVAESGEQPLPEALKAHLRERRCLLLVDNFEHLLDAAPLLTQLLAAAGNVEMLVTSRAALRVSGEYELPVAPLELPDLRRLPPGEALMQYAAVELFVARAQAVKPGFALSAENAPAVAEICVKLDGLPLAIELAAARVKLLAPQAMLTRLDSRLKLLTGGARDLPTRQQTLRGAIEWSYNLLDAGEKELFARLGVFTGGYGLEAVELVCNAAGDLALDPLDGVASLAEKSLLRQGEDADGEPRFTMLETLREYALERLEQAGQAAALRAAHAQYYLALAEQAEPELSGAEQVTWLRRLEDRHDNLRAAIAWALESGDIAVALRFCGALWRFWYTRGHLSEGRRWLEQALDPKRPGIAEVAPELRARAVYGLGSLAMTQGDYSRAKEHFGESLAIYQTLDDKLGVARSLNCLGIVAKDLGDTQQAQAFYVKNLELLRAIDYKPGIAATLANLAEIALHVNDYPQAARYHEESLAIERLLENTLGIAISLINLGEVTLLQNDLAHANQYYNESLRLSQQLEDGKQIAYCLEGLARVAAVRCQFERAARLWGAATALREAVQAPLQPGDHDHYQAAVEQAKAQSGSTAWDGLWLEGRSLALEKAIALALEE